MTSKAVNNLNAVVDASNQNVLSGAGAKQESSGILCISKILKSGSNIPERK